MPEAVNDKKTTRPIDKIDITKMPVKKYTQRNRQDIEAGTLYQLFTPKNDPGKFKRKCQLK